LGIQAVVVIRQTGQDETSSHPHENLLALRLLGDYGSGFKWGGGGP